MINIFRDNKGKLMGVYSEYLSHALLMVEKDLPSYIYKNWIEELAKEDTSGLFTYKIIESSKEVSRDLFGVNYAIIFEFVPNKELIEEFRVLNERMEIGL